MSLADLKDESIAMTYYGCVARPCACPACAPRKHSPLPCACGRWQGVAESLFKITTIAQFAALDTEARNAMSPEVVCRLYDAWEEVDDEDSILQ